MKRSPLMESFKLGFEVGATGLARSLASTLGIGNYDNYWDSVQERIIELRKEFAENRKTLDIGAKTGMYSGLIFLGGTITGLISGTYYLYN